MSYDVFTVMPQGRDWIVRQGEELKGRFGDTQPAVALARELAGEVWSDGGRARVLVHFAPQD